MKLKHYLPVFFILLSVTSFSQGQDSTKQTNGKPYSFVPFPAVSFDSDLGFQYGLLGSFNYYGDRSVYPDYLWSVYAEWSRYTKGSGTNQLFFDSKYLLPYDLRITGEFTYLTEKALNFYGFNGFESAYFPEFEDDEASDYISRMYYRHERKMLRIGLDFQHDLVNRKWRWLAGFGYFNNKIGPVDIEKINKGLPDDKKVPDTAALYDKYVDWGLIGKEEADGGSINNVKLGLVYDTRDNEPDPSKGIWAEAIMVTAPQFLGNNEAAYTKMALIWRQYLPVVRDKITFAYRLGWQGTIDGKTPFYMQSYMITTNLKVTQNDGLGGGKSLRGILRNRVVGDAIAYSNFELRYKLMQLAILNTDFYFTLSAFGDFGMVTKRIEFNKSLLPEEEKPDLYFDLEKDKLHSTFGGGVHVDIERNLIIAVDYGMAADKRDGESGLYIGIGFLF
ncbi:MAG TPA: BamA/TamA family outer membrane protein [Lentimicrobium sp.]|nr:BamA/TamA family outer membrane protein [Lentimicrobium sp.]